jgi:transposase InsO family protein
LVKRVMQENWTVRQAAEAAGISVRRAHVWLSRYREEGCSGLADRSSRPHRCPAQTPARLVRRVEELRRRRLTAWEIAERVPLAPSTVSLILHRIGLGKLWRLEPEQPVRRYEHSRPGALVHLDAKKLGKINGIGHRIHKDRRRRHRGAGWEVAFVCVDDHTRMAYAEVLPKENAIHAEAFFRRALRRFQSLGVTVERVMTDNAKCYESNRFRALCRERGVRQTFIKPYTPRTNGKAERFIQTLKNRWAYRRAYRSSALRAEALRPWLKHYNHERPHRALGMRPPVARLREGREQRA